MVYALEDNYQDGRYVPDKAGSYDALLQDGGRYYHDDSGRYIPDYTGLYRHDGLGYYANDGTGLYKGDVSGKFPIKYLPKHLDIFIKKKKYIKMVLVDSLSIKVKNRFSQFFIIYINC